MKTHGSIWIGFIAFLAIVLTACNAEIPVTGPTTIATSPAVTEETVGAATATATPTQTVTPTSTTEPTAAITDTPIATITVEPVVLKPTPTPLLLVNIPIEGGDPKNKFFASLIFPKYQPAATNSLWFRALAHKPSDRKVDGEGIATVDFLISDSQGKKVYFREENTPAYCAFGGDTPNCPAWDFASHGYAWPDGGKIVSGGYTITVTVTAKDKSVMFGSADFRIQVP
jgi:hypothetical protein